MSITIADTVKLPATPKVVWGALTDFAAYREWNPFMDRVDGTLQVGQKLRVHMTPPGGRGITFRPRVLVVDPERELRWLGSLGVRGIFDGEHFFTLAPDGHGETSLTQGETFRGVLVPLLRRSVKGAAAGFEAFNEALAARLLDQRSLAA